MIEVRRATSAPAHAVWKVLKDVDAPVGALAGGGNWGCVAR
jgi:hypothetical protein